MVAVVIIWSKLVWLTPLGTSNNKLAASYLYSQDGLTILGGILTGQTANDQFETNCYLKGTICKIFGLK